ncbi:MAG: glycosyl hydrolase family 18 protein [Candidatus Neomarinimicrobiota bacterium]
MWKTVHIRSCETGKQFRIYIKIVMYRNIVLVLFTAAALAQNYPSIHQLELEWHRENFAEPAYKLSSDPVLPLQLRTAAPSKKIFGYHPYWQGTSWLYYNYDLLTTIAYFSAEASGEGALNNLHGWPPADMINKAHENGVKVVLTVSLFSNDNLTTLLSNSDNRTRLINNLLEQVKNAGADGVNVDFELMPASQKTNMVTFISSLTKVFHDSLSGSEVTLAMPAVDWSAAWDYNQLAAVSDGLFIMGYDYHWKGSSTTGPVAPLSGGTYNITNTINDYLTITGSQAEKLILGNPYYGYEWPVNSSDAGTNVTGEGSAVLFNTAESRALSYGKRWHAESQTPWYYYTGRQGWYDDSTSLSLKYDFAIEKDLGGVGMWALGYDQGYTDLWEALKNKFGKSTSPSIPNEYSQVNWGSGLVVLDFSGSESADYYAVERRFLESDSVESLGIFTSRPIIMDNLNQDETYFLKIKSGNDQGESSFTELLGVVPSVSPAEVLIVNGFDRVSGTNNTFDFILQHGSAIQAAGYYFDSASNEAVISGRINLNDYKIVDWILGEEATATGSFSSQEQKLIEEYLIQGGNLIISGSEVGYDLDEKGSSDDLLFYANFLKAEYITDAAAGRQGTYSAQGVSGSFLDGVQLNFDDGSHGTYDVDWPDGIKPLGQAELILKYGGTDYDSNGGAGIAYRGWFGNSFREAALVYLAFGFESIYPVEVRNETMLKILDYLEGPTVSVTSEDPALPDRLSISNIYPNPSNNAVTIEFRIGNIDTEVSLKILDLLGREVFNRKISPGSKDNKVRWNGRFYNGEKASSGLYLAKLQQGARFQTKKFTLLK